MPGGHYIALSGMRTRLDQLDRLATDLANAETTGYKGERISTAEEQRSAFSDQLTSAIDVSLSGRRLDTSAGTIEPTGMELDMAIDGEGYFEISTPAGLRYTRNGHFARSGSGQLVTSEGLPVMGENGPIELQPGPVSVGSDGMVMTTSGPAGRIKVVRFDEPGRLVREGRGRLNASGMTPLDGTAYAIRPQSLEGSNVSVVMHVAELANVTRAFEALQKSVAVFMNDIDGKAIESFGRR